MVVSRPFAKTPQKHTLQPSHSSHIQTDTHKMHILLVRLLQGAAAAIALLLFRVVTFLFRCFRAHKRFKNSPIPGPPEASMILGEWPCVA